MTDDEKSLLLTKFEVTDFNEDYTFSANDVVTVIGDALATLIRDLAKKGIINPDSTFTA